MRKYTPEVKPITEKDAYGDREIVIPAGYREIGFRPVRPNEYWLSAIGNGTVVESGPVHISTEKAPRIILEKIAPRRFVFEECASFEEATVCPGYNDSFRYALRSGGSIGASIISNEYLVCWLKLVKE